jgi:hypothetical protein
MRSFKLVLPTTALLLGAALSQTRPASAQEQTIQIQVTANDYAAARDARHRVHTTGALRPEGGHHPAKTFETDSSGALVEVTGISRSSIQSMPIAASQAATVTPPFMGPGFYPADLSLFTTNGQVVTSAHIHNIYLNCTGACWGNPSAFENRLFSSRFMDVVDQYVGSDEEGRYRLGSSVMIANYPITQTLVTNPVVNFTDLDAILHAAGSSLGTGYNQIYNIFFPKGVDVCEGYAPPYQFCFSPDNFATWTFCAFHGADVFSDIGTVLVTVEPYPDAFALNNGLPFYGCDVGQPAPQTTNTVPTPNGVLVDTVSSLLDHEIFETITDPDGLEWTTELYAGSILIEIGDLCQLPAFIYTPFYVSGHLYEIQPEYSNKYHACVTVP